MISPSCVLATPLAVVRFKFLTVWLSIPLKSIVFSDLAITRISLLTMHPFAPWLINADKSTWVCDIFSDDLVTYTLHVAWSLPEGGDSISG